jgi:hypothetical protein
VKIAAFAKRSQSLTRASRRARIGHHHHASNRQQPGRQRNQAGRRHERQTVSAGARRSVLLTSVPLGWRGIVVEWHRLEPQELPDHYVVGHGLAVSTGKRPISFGWRDGKRWREGMLNPGEFHLLTHGDLNTPRLLQTFDEITLVLDPRFVADVVPDGLPADQVEFATQRSACDASIARYAEAFCAELSGDSPNGSLYVDTLTVGFALHLLCNYAVATPKIPLPRGKLNSFQLRTVVDSCSKRRTLRQAALYPC